MIIDEQALPPTEAFLGTLTVIVVYSAVTEYTKYICSLKEQATLRDTFIYQVNSSVFLYYLREKYLVGIVMYTIYVIPRCLSALEASSFKHQCL